mgnify:CR=1 FL=1
MLVVLVQGGDTQGSKITASGFVAIYQSISIAEGSSIEATADLHLGCGHEPIAPILSSELCPERVGPPAQPPQNITSDSPMASGEVPKS